MRCSFLIASALAAVATAQDTLHFIHPHPLAGTELTAENVDTILGHYGKPPEGCASDEQAFQISGVPGMVNTSLTAVLLRCCASTS